MESGAARGYYFRSQSAHKRRMLPRRKSGKHSSGRTVETLVGAKRKHSLPPSAQEARYKRRKVFHQERHAAKVSNFDPFQRSCEVKLHPFPIMRIPSPRLTYVTASMQFLISAISDKDLDTLRQKSPPAEHSTAWSNIRNALCACQMALRNRQEEQALPLSFTGRLMLALYRYGQATKDSEILDLFPQGLKCTQHTKPADFITKNLEKFTLQSPTHFMCCLARILTDNPQKEWGGFVQQKNVHTSVVEVIHDYEIVHKLVKNEDSVGIEIPLDQLSKSSGSDIESLLAEANIEKVDNKAVDWTVAKACYEDACTHLKDVVGLKEHRAIQLAIAQKLRAGEKSWDSGKLRPHYTGTEWHLSDKDADAVLMRMPVFLTDQDKSVPKRQDLREEVILLEGTQWITVLYDDINEKRYQEFILPAAQAAAFQIAQELYRIAGFKVAGVSCTGIDNDGCRHLLVTLPETHQGGGTFCYDPIQVLRKMQEGARYNAAIVFDAWLKNDAVHTFKLATVPICDAASGELEVEHVYRLEFNCMGFGEHFGKGTGGGEELYGADARPDLEILKESPYFEGLKDSEIALGLEQLFKLRDETIFEVVAHYWPESDDHGTTIADQLLERKRSLLNKKQDMLESWTASQEHLAKPLTPVFHGKRHYAAIKAVCDSPNPVKIPNIFLNDKPQEVKGSLRTLLCHKGDTHDNGTYITLHRIESTWFIVDDTNKDGLGAISIDEYLVSKGLSHLIKPTFPTGTDMLKNLLQCGFLRITPELMMWELNTTQKRKEWCSNFENVVIRNWQSACDQENSPETESEAEAGSGTDVDSDSEYRDCVSEQEVHGDDNENTVSEPDAPEDEERIYTEQTLSSPVGSVICESDSAIEENDEDTDSVIAPVSQARLIETHARGQSVDSSYIWVIKNGELVAVPPKDMSSLCSGPA